MAQLKVKIECMCALMSWSQMRQIMNDEFTSSTADLLSLQLMHLDIIQQSVDAYNVYSVDDVHNAPHQQPLCTRISFLTRRRLEQTPGVL